MKTIKEKLVLDWNIDDASQDGYLHTRSFPLILGDEEVFAEIKTQRKPIVMLIGESDAIVAISREKYPNELSSIVSGSKKEKLLNDVINNHPDLERKKIIGFSYLYLKLLNVINGSNRRNIKVKKGVRIQLYSTNHMNVFRLHSIIDGSNRWRNYREGDYISRDKLEAVEKSKIKAYKKLPLSLLRKKIEQKKIQIKKSKVYTEQFVRNPDVVVYALKRSKGFCELCKKVAPFKKDNGDLYLEVHHLLPLSRNGKDHPMNVAALCANCHRLLHHSKDRKIQTEKLTKDVEAKEIELF